MFDGIAARYDLVNGLVSLGQDRRWRRAVVEAIGVRPGERVLDIAAGTGSSSIPLARRGAEVIASDISSGMLKVGRQRHPELTFVEADATALPFDDATFDVVTCSFGLRNVPDAPLALREALRVTRSGGRLVLCEFSTPTWGPFRRVYQDYLMRLLPSLAGRVTGDRGSYEYLAETIAAWPDQLGLAAWLRDSGWRRIGYRNLSGGIVALHRAEAP